MDGSNGKGTRINSFALVSYLNGPLANFLDDLRLELSPGCVARAHITVLPPRPLQAPPEQACSEIAEYLQDFQPFTVELDRIQVFPESQVIYLSIGKGARELEQLHQALNRGNLAFREPYPYHPHITLAQELISETMPRVMEAASRRWSEWKYPRSFFLDRLTFVQNTVENRWADLATLELATQVAK